MAEQVKKASHYQNDNPLYEVWRVIRAWKLNFNKGSAVKYIARAGKKDDEIMELEKAREFLAFEIEAIKEQRAKEAERKAQEPKKHFVKPECTEVDPFKDLLDTVGNLTGAEVVKIAIKIPDGTDPERIISEIEKRLRS